MECKNCQGFCVKKGCRNRRQKYYCKGCKLYQLKTRCYKSCTEEDELMILKLNNEGVGIRSISRITGISESNVVTKIKKLGSKIKKAKISEEQQEYEVDEMHTFVKCKSNLLALNPKKNFTDKLNVYPGLIDKSIHTAVFTRSITSHHNTMRHPGKLLKPSYNLQYMGFKMPFTLSETSWLPGIFTCSW